MKRYKNLLLSFALLSIISILFCGCLKKDENDEIGKKYTSSAVGYSSDITVEIRITPEGNIGSLKVDASKENTDIGLNAASSIAREIVAKQSLSVDAVSGATITSNAVIVATEKALNEAGINTEVYKKVKNE